MTENCFVKSMAIFLTIFRNVDADKKTQNTWFDLLEDLSDDDFKYAIKKICNEVKDIYPTTNFVGLVRDQLKSNDNDAILAWDEALKELRQSGKYASFKKNPVIEVTIKAMGGWNVLLHSEEKNLIFLQKQFCDIFKTMKIQGEKRKLLIVDEGVKVECDELVNNFMDKMGKI